MSNLVTIIIVLLTLVYILGYLISGNRKKAETSAYQWWHIPWFALLYVVLMYLVYYDSDFQDWDIVNDIIGEHHVEAAFFLFCAGIWVVIERMILRRDFVHKKLIKLFRNLFAGKRSDKDKVLPFPYYLDEEDKVRTKPGQVFYRRTMKVLIIFITLVYVVFFLLSAFADLDFYPISALGLLGLIPLVDYYVYLCAEAPVERKDKEIVVEESVSNFDELWSLYTNTFDNYTVAWKRTLKEKELKKNKANKMNNDDDWEDMMKLFSENHLDGIILNCDLVTAFMKLEPIFDHVEKNGRFVLIAIDVPNHFIKNEEKTYVDAIADKLRLVIKKDFSVYGGKSSVESLSNSVVLAPLSVVSGQGLYKEWMEKIGLIVVANIFDKNISNMYESRRFSYVLQTVNPDYQLLFVAPYCREVQPSIANSWLTSTETPVEKAMKQFPNSSRQFFIGYNYEDYGARVERVFVSRPSEPLYSGSELAPLALSSTAEGHIKAVTPVHYLELAYSNAIEGKEEIGKFASLLNEEYQVASKDINENIKNHLLPVERIEERQIFSIIYDRDNNAPAVYANWQHLGLEENFSIVISKPYLFRDYFNANHSFFVGAPFAAIQPSLCKSRITLAIVLLKLLQNAEMEEEELCDLLLFYYDSSEIKSVSTLIKDLFTTYFTRDLARSLVTEDVVEFDGEKYHHHIKYKLSLYGDNDQRFLDTVTVKDESGNALFDIVRDLMEQNYVAGQIHTFSGRPYQIRDFNSRTKTLNVSRVNNSDKDILFYRPSMKVKVAGDRIPIKEMNSAELKPKVWRHRETDQELSIVFDGFETGVEVATTEWFEFNKYTLYGYVKTGSSAKPRYYSNGKVLKISFKYVSKPEYVKRIDDIRKGLQILLYEVMQSVFPHHAQYLIISSLGEGDPDLPWIFNSLECDDSQEEGMLTYYFIEDAHIDLGLIGVLAKTETIWYIFQYLYDYLIWLTEGKQVRPAGFDAYPIRKKPDKLAFLKYGRDHLPNYLDIDLLISFIKDFYEDGKVLQKVVKDRQGQYDTANDSSAVDTNSPSNAVYEKVKTMFRDYLGIDFGWIPHKVPQFSSTSYPFNAMVREMTYIWENYNENFKKVRKTNEDLVEGLAVWTDLYLSERNGAMDIAWRRAQYLAKNDKAGRGLKFILDHCPNNPYVYIQQMAKGL